FPADGDGLGCPFPSNSLLAIDVAIDQGCTRRRLGGAHAGPPCARRASSQSWTPLSRTCGDASRLGIVAGAKGAAYRHDSLRPRVAGAYLPERVRATSWGVVEWMTSRARCVASLRGEAAIGKCYDIAIADFGPDAGGRLGAWLNEPRKLE